MLLLCLSDGGGSESQAAKQHFSFRGEFTFNPVLLDIMR